MNCKLWIRKIFSKVFPSTIKQKSINTAPKLSLLPLEERIVPAVPFAPAFPHALSINAPGSTVTNSASFSVTFNQPVVGVDASDFQLVTTGTVAGGTISSVTGSGDSYTVSVTGITGTGTLGLNLVDLPTITALPSFAAQQTFAAGTGRNPYSVTLGDVNGDGRLDIVTANDANNNASVLLGNGNGTFQGEQTFATGTFSRSGTLGDVNGDGKLDLITANFQSNNVSVLLGNGDGTFLGQQTFATGFNPSSVTLGDVNGDGKLDIVTGNRGSDNVSVLLGNGDGTFLGQQTFATGARPDSITLGDVNGDGRLDIVTANYRTNNASLLLGNGDGTFQGQQTFATANGPSFVKLGDVNGDGRLDIVTANYGSNNASVLLGNGNGTFQGQQIFATGTRPTSVTLGDVNGDGRLDIVTANSNSTNASVLLGTGGSAITATFSPQQTFATGTGTSSVALGDVNGDGVLDMITANQTSNSASVLLGNGNGTFQTKVEFATGVKPRFVTLGDVNDDGRLDIITANRDSNNISVLLGNGNGTFQTQATFATGTSPRNVTLGDVNGDGILDIITANRNSDNTSILLGNGDGTFQTQQTFATGLQPQSGTLGDANGDGKLDIITANFSSNTTSVLLGNGNGTFQTQATFATGTNPRSVTLGDVNADGKLDIVFANASSDTASVLLGNGNGTFQTQATFAIGDGPSSVTLGDMNGDGKLDIITTNENSDDSSLLLGNGDGTFAAQATFAMGDGPLSVTLGDVNGDGRLDITIANYSTNNASVLLNSLAFTGQTANVASAPTPTPTPTPVPLVTGSAPPTGNNPNNPGNSVNLYDAQTGQPNGVAVPFPNFMGQIRVAAGDFNQDGRSELVAAAGPGGGPAVTILDSQTGVPRAAFFAYDSSFTGGVFVAVKDINNDGVADIITGAGIGGGPHVKVFNGVNLQEIRSFFAYTESFTGGVSVATADINGDNVLDLVTGAGPGGGPHVKVFDGATNALISSWFAYPVNFTGGVFVGMGDISNDGNFEVITGAGIGGGPVVAVWNPFTGLLHSQFFAYAQSFSGGVRVGVSDATGDGILDLVTGAGPGGGPQVNAYNFPNLDLLFSFFSGPVDNRQGVFVS